MISRPQPLAQILIYCTPIERLRRSAYRREQLLERVRAALPPPLGAHCLSAGLSERGLVLTADSPVWATRLRFSVPRITEHLPDVPPGRAVRVRVRPADTSAGRLQTKRRLTLSARNARLLRETAEGIADPELSRALERLSCAGY
jgi:hypothetical protein